MCPCSVEVQVFQKYSPGFKSTPSGGFSLTKVALTQFGSDGAETRVAALVGVIAGVSGVSRLGPVTSVQWLVLPVQFL